MKPAKVLFLCTANSCRSQMAEGLLRHYAGDRFEVASAGTKPTGLNERAVEVMHEIGIDISGQKSKHVNSLLGEDFTHVITVCDNARESCPAFPAKVSRSHWSFEDPAQARGSEPERMAVFRRVRDGLAAKIRKFLAGQSW